MIPAHKVPRLSSRHLKTALTRFFPRSKSLQNDGYACRHLLLRRRLHAILLLPYLRITFCPHLQSVCSLVKFWSFENHLRHVCPTETLRYHFYRRILQLIFFILALLWVCNHPHPQQSCYLHPPYSYSYFQIC